ncbi:MAG: hypothetical protein IT405_03575, partial [Candidatus Yanofskybacteria bacterium]|nr:hypothetical protein [Candidatus Yanofskybacteria bacterium]
EKAAAEKAAAEKAAAEKAAAEKAAAEKAAAEKAAAEKAAAELRPEEPSAEHSTEKTAPVEVGPKPKREGFLSRFWEWMEEKPAIEIWLDGQRARPFAAINGYFQGRAEGKLQLAEDRLKEYERKLAGAGLFKKMWYGERIVEWQERVAELTAKAEAWNIWRETHVERHRTFARGVIDRYEQELAPYRGLAHDFSSRMDVQQNIRVALAQKRDEAMKLLVETESAGRKGRWTVRPDARREVDRIRKQIEEINRRIRQAERAVEMNRTELGRVHAKIREGELKRDAVAASMKFPEFDALRTYARPKETVPAPASEKIELRKWDTAKFIEAWNGLGLVRIEDEQGFITHVEREREVSGASGLPTTEELLDLVSSYIEGAGISKAQKQQLKRDKQFFLDNA